MEKPAASSAALSGTAVSRSSMVIRIWDGMAGNQTDSRNAWKVNDARAAVPLRRSATLVTVTDNLREQLQHTLGDAYRIERELGGGGMSRVFVAVETALAAAGGGQGAACPSWPPGVSVERFRREIQLAAQLQHPHIVPASRRRASPTGSPTSPCRSSTASRSGPGCCGSGELPVAEAVRLLRDVASALAYAHEQRRGAPRHQARQRAALRTARPW